MTKSKNRVKAEATIDQRYEFTIGPAVSWFLPHSADIWSAKQVSGDDTQLAWFIYGSKAAFCYGRISSENGTNSPVALTDHIEYIKNDNSRVICCRFCKNLTNRPLALVLTENGTVIFYDCINRAIILRYTKNDIVNKVSEKLEKIHDNNEQPFAKKLKFSIHLSSISWLDLNNAFLSVSMSREETSFVIWMKIPDSIMQVNMEHDKNLIEFRRVNTSVSSADIVCMETLPMDNVNMIYVAVGFDDGMINVIKLNQNIESSVNEIRKTQVEVTVFKKHTKSICSLSLWSPNTEKHEYSSGILASVARSGLVLLWDLNNEYCFADYDINLKSTDKVNWFAASFYTLKNSQLPYLAVSNMTGGLVNLEMPKRIHPSKRPLNGKNVHGAEGLLKHRSLIFNVTFDSNSSILMTTSLDNNLIFWNCSQKEEVSNNNKKILSRIDPCFLLPTMANNSRTHKMRFSPIANDNLVTALGEAGLCFYRVPSERKDFRFHMTRGCASVCYEIKKQKLTPTTLAWQPNHEYRLAVGTREGLVLRLDISNNGLVLQSLPLTKSVKNSGDSIDIDCDFEPSDSYQNHTDDKTTVSTTTTTGIYSLCWGPNPVDRNKSAIYTITSQKLAIYTAEDEKSKENLKNLVDTMSDKFTNISEFTAGVAAEVSWKNDFDLMALGTTDGTILILQLSDQDTYSFQKLTIIKDVFKAIQALAWHPTTYKDSEYYYYLAVAPKELPNSPVDLHLFDLRSKITLGESHQFNECGQVIESTIKLSGHAKTIAEISWSPHQENHLCTCSFDAKNIVWTIDVCDQSYKILSEFVARDRLFTTEWSAVDNDLVLTSGRDSTIVAWRPSENMLDCTS